MTLGSVSFARPMVGHGAPADRDAQDLFVAIRNRLECKVMSAPSSPSEPLWSSPGRFFLAAFGALAGMDSFSEFPYLLTHFGGATFVGTYLVAVLCVAWPVLAAELALGRRSRGRGGIGRIQTTRVWRWTLGAGVVGGFLMFSYVAVVCGWMLFYIHGVLTGAFRRATAPFVAAYFADVVAHPFSALGWEGGFLFLVVFVVAGGTGAIEDLARFLVPGVVGIFAGLLAFAVARGSFFVSAPLLLYARPVAHQEVLALVALSQAFFGPALGTGALLAYGAWLPVSVSAPRAALGLVLVQVFVAWLGGFALASLTFAVGLSPLAGGGFLFETLPLMSARLPAGEIVAALCYLALVAAAWLSAVAWLEPAIQLLVGKGLSRPRAAIGLGVVALMLGGVLMLSLNSWAFSFTFFGRLKTLGALDILMITAVNVLLPWGGGGLSALMGWGQNGLLGPGEPMTRGRRLWLWALRALVPTAVLIVILTAPRLIL